MKKPNLHLTLEEYSNYLRKRDIVNNLQDPEATATFALSFARIYNVEPYAHTEIHMTRIFEVCDYPFQWCPRCEEFINNPFMYIARDELETLKEKLMNL